MTFFGFDLDMFSHFAIGQLGDYKKRVVIHAIVDTEKQVVGTPSTKWMSQEAAVILANLYSQGFIRIGDNIIRPESIKQLLIKPTIGGTYAIWVTFQHRHVAFIRTTSFSSYNEAKTVLNKLGLAEFNNPHAYQNAFHSAALQYYTESI